MSIVEILKKHCIILSFLIMLSAVTSASEWQTQIQADICQQWHAISAAEAECELSFIGVSNQYSLPHCNGTWQHNLTRGLHAGRNGIEISCNSPMWKQNLAVQLHIYKNVVVLAKPVSMGTKIKPQDITQVRHDIGSSSKDYYVDSKRVIGNVLKRSLKVGTLLTTDLLEAPLLINRNDRVTIVLSRPGITVESKGIALENGKHEQRIRVRNVRSQKVVTATVKEQGIVEIN